MTGKVTHRYKSSEFGLLVLNSANNEEEARETDYHRRPSQRSKALAGQLARVLVMSFLVKGSFGHTERMTISYTKSRPSGDVIRSEMTVSQLRRKLPSQAYDEAYLLSQG